jgi:gliding motility-associated-like protein
VFTVGGLEENIGDLYYHIVDMDLEGGLGAIEPANSNVGMGEGYTERLAVASATNCNYWLITHRKNESNIEARLITANGISSPVISNTSTRQGIAIGQNKFSPDDRRMVAAIVSGFVELMDFDRSSGQFSNLIQLPVSPGSSPYSACFSPDGSKLYLAEGKQGSFTDIYQFDLSVYQPSAISNSRMMVGSTSTSFSNQFSLSDLQTGPDGVLYFSRGGTNCMGSIPEPNKRPPDCGFNQNAFCFPQRSSICLPNAVRVGGRLADFSLGKDTSLCPGVSMTLRAPAISATVLWSTGQTTRTITVSQPGRYWLRLTNGVCVASDTIEISFEHQKVDLGKDSTICTGSAYELKTKNLYAAYRWSDGSSGPALLISQPGTYWVEVTDDCGRKSSDTINILEDRHPLSLGPNQTICEGQRLTLQASGNYTSYQWGPDYNLGIATGATVQVFPARDTTYFVQAEVFPGCLTVDSIRVSVIASQKVVLPADTTFCAGETIRLHAGPGFTRYLWHNQSTQPTVELKDPVIAWVEVEDSNGCISRDSTELKWDACGTDLWIPSSFSPNGDGRNETFRALYRGALASFRLTVYNRWGQVVYQTSNAGQGWNGKLAGKELETGVYVWTCQYQLFGGKRKQLKGTVTLIR